MRLGDTFVEPFEKKSLSFIASARSAKDYAAKFEGDALNPIVAFQVERFRHLRGDLVLRANLLARLVRWLSINIRLEASHITKSDMKNYHTAL